MVKRKKSRPYFGKNLYKKMKETTKLIFDFDNEEVTAAGELILSKSYSDGIIYYLYL